jgi:hypothetical protein
MGRKVSLKGIKSPIETVLSTWLNFRYLRGSCLLFCWLFLKSNEKLPVFFGLSKDRFCLLESLMSNDIKRLLRDAFAELR